MMCALFSFTLVVLQLLHNTEAENLLYVMGIMYPVVHQAAWYRALSKIVLSTKFQDSHLWHKNVPPGYRALLHCTTMVNTLIGTISWFAVQS